MSLLICAASSLETELVKCLISHGADIKAVDSHNKTALHYSASFKFYNDNSDILISHDVDINAKDDMGKTALHLAAESQNIELAFILISHGADPYIKDMFGDTPLDIATKKRNQELIDELIPPKEEQ